MAVSIIATISMLIVGAVAKLLTRDWCHPAAIFATFWAIACGVSILVAPENISSGSGPLWILLNTVFVAAGAITGAAFACTSQSRRVAIASSVQCQSCPMSNRWLRTAAAICIFLALLYLGLWLRLQGIDAASLTSLQNLARSALKMSIARYSGTAVTPIYIQLLLTTVYLAPLFGGALYLQRQRRSDTALALLSVLPSLVCFATQSTRSSVLYGATMWIAGYLSIRPYLGIRAAKFKKKTLASGIAAVLLMFLLMTVGDSLRSGGAQDNANTQNLVTNRTKTYLGGHVAALSQWLDDSDLGAISPSPGRYTLVGLYELIQPGTRVGGVIGQFVTITTGYTNVFTYFRELIEDATVAGSLAIILVLAFCGGFAYRKVAERRAAWIGILAAFYAGALFGISSIFGYNSMILALALYSAAWARSRRKKEILAWAQ